MKLLALSSLLVAATAVPLAQQCSAVVGKNFQQWGFLIMENQDYDATEATPAFQQIQNMSNNRLLSNYFAVAHPSLPNYLASIAGTTFGVTDDSPPAVHAQNAPSILDLLEKKGISWKMYAENYPGNCFLGATNGIPHSYAVKHVPALYMKSITSKPSRCANVVNASEFETDFQAGTLPQWWYYVPNLNNDGHDTGLSYVADYLNSTWIPRFQDPTFTKDLAMVMTYDESETYDAPNHIYAALIGDALTNNGVRNDTTEYSHYSLIKTVEDNWGLGSLGKNDTTATAIEI